MNLAPSPRYPHIAMLAVFPSDPFQKCPYDPTKVSIFQPFQFPFVSVLADLYKFIKKHTGLLAAQTANNESPVSRMAESDHFRMSAVL